MLRAFATLLLVVLSFFGPGQVHGQVDAPPPSVEARYRQLIAEGVAEHKADASEEALALFTKAYALWPNARALRAIGAVEFDLRRYVECVVHLQQALESRVMPLTPEQRSETENILGRARQYVARVVLEISPAVAKAKAQIVVDGSQVTLPSDGSQWLQVGTHAIEIQAEGFNPERRTLLLRTGAEEQRLQFVLRPNSAPVLISVEPMNAPIDLSIDGAAVALPRDRVLRLQLGERLLEARAEGFASERRRVLVYDAEEQTVLFNLRPLTAARPSSDSSPSLWSSPWLWAGLGAVLAGGITVALVASSGRSAGTAPFYQGDLGVLQGPGKP